MNETTADDLTCDCGHIQLDHYRMYGGCSSCECPRFAEPKTNGAYLKWADSRTSEIDKLTSQIAALRSALEQSNRLLGEIHDWDMVDWVDINHRKKWREKIRDALAATPADPVREAATALVNESEVKRKIFNRLLSVYHDRDGFAPVSERLRKFIDELGDEINQTALEAK